LDGGGADAGGGRVDEDRLAELKAELGEEGVVGGDEDLWEGGGLDPIEGIGHLREGALGGEDELGLGAAAGDAEDAAAGLPPEDGGADGDDLAGELEAGDIAGSAGRRRVMAAALEDIGAIEAGGVDADEDLVSPGEGGVGELADGENFRASGFCDDDGAHGL